MLDANKDLLKNIIARFRGKRVAVVGDLMLDAYVWGKVERISPEAPVPIVQVERRSCCLGGAANVMRNVVTLGGEVRAFGLMGADANGTLLKKLLAEYAIDPEGIQVDPDRPTTEKQRVIAGAQQLMRVDYEDQSPVADGIRAEIIDRITRLIRDRQVDAVILEDYAKGLLSREMAQAITDCAREHGIVVTLDPNPRNRMVIKGLSMMKPNRGEAFALAGKSAPAPGVDPARDRKLLEVAATIQQEWEMEYLLISLAAQGMALFHRDADLTVIPTRAREVYDVSGAGDTVIAAATLALTTGCDGKYAAEIANHAAGIVVGKLGTVTVGADEVLDSIAGA